MNGYTVTLGNTISIGLKKPFVLNAPLIGWGRAETRTYTFNNAGADGGQVPDQYYGLRQIPLKFTLLADTCEQHDQLRMDLEAALPIRQEIQVTLTTPTGRVYGTMAKVLDVDPEIIHSKRTEYTVELVSGDHLLYDYTDGNAMEVTIEKLTTGGFVLPVNFPINFAAGSAPVAVNNTGLVDIKPLITLTGSAQVPILTNNSTGEFLKLNLTMLSTDVVEIDMARQEVTLNDGNIRSLVDPLSTFWALSPGQTQVSLESQGVGDTVTANLRWYNGYLSI